MVKLDDIKEILDLINERDCYYDFSDSYGELSLKVKEKICLIQIIATTPLIVSDNTLENILIDILDNDLNIESKEVKYLTYSIGVLSKKISNMIE